MNTQTQKSTMTVEEMNAKYQAAIAVLEQMEIVLEEKLTAGPAAAQANRLVAMGLARQANAILNQVGELLQYLSAPETPVAAESEDLLSNLAHIAEEFVEELMDQFGVDKEAIVPFVYEISAIMIPVSEDLLAKAQEKLAIADALSKGESEQPEV